VRTLPTKQDAQSLECNMRFLPFTLIQRDIEKLLKTKPNDYSRGKNLGAPR
jgi:hypothetical protein